jgi:hypothetical protein
MGPLLGLTTMVDPTRCARARGAGGGGVERSQTIQQQPEHDGFAATAFVNALTLPPLPPAPSTPQPAARRQSRQPRTRGVCLAPRLPREPGECAARAPQRRARTTCS